MPLQEIVRPVRGLRAWIAARTGWPCRGRPETERAGIPWSRFLDRGPSQAYTLGMHLAVRCDHCPWQKTPLFLADEIDEREEAQMRNHLRSTHPTLVSPRDLAHLVTHFRISRAISSHFRD